MITSVYLHHSSAAIMKFSLCWLVEEKKITRVLLEKLFGAFYFLKYIFFIFLFMMLLSDASGSETVVYTGWAPNSCC